MVLQVLQNFVDLGLLLEILVAESAQLVNHFFVDLLALFFELLLDSIAPVIERDDDVVDSIHLLQLLLLVHHHLLHAAVVQFDLVSQLLAHLASPLFELCHLGVEIVEAINSFFRFE